MQIFYQDGYICAENILMYFNYKYFYFVMFVKRAELKALESTVLCISSQGLILWSDQTVHEA